METTCVCTTRNVCLSSLECANDLPCTITCNNRCKGTTVYCPEWGDCNVVCKSCQDVTVVCPADRTTPCIVTCANADACQNVTLQTPDNTKLYCMDSAACDVATLTSAAPSGLMSADCTAAPPALGPDKALAFVNCKAPWTHGLSCVDACEGVTYTCVSGKWDPPTPPQCGQDPYACGGDTTNYRLLNESASCRSVEIALQQTYDLSHCAAQCGLTPGCRFFSYTNATGICAWKQTESGDCPEGFDAPADVSFYEPIPVTRPCNDNGECTSIGCLCYASSLTGYWAGEYCDTCAPGYATQDCSVACSGGACAVCGDRGWCKEGTAGDGSCTCGQGWALPSCTECEKNRFGLDCRGECPADQINVVCSNHGVCSDGRTGNGSCVCSSGWAEPLCDTCDKFHWGGDCSGMCPGNGTCSDHGSCNKSTGVCTCDPGWGGSECELVCLCNGNGVCVASDPPCQCNVGYALPNCKNCEDGYAGLNCAVLCPGAPDNPCGGHGTCDPIRAVCDCPGWYDSPTGTPCSETCPLGPGALVCSGHGRCDGPVNNFTCSCDANWDGDDCNSCDEYHSGSDCSKPCPAVFDTVSNSSLVCSGHGECFDGECYCTTDRCGPACEDSTNCQSLCTQGKYGENCTGLCPGYSQGQICHGHGGCSNSRSGTGECVCQARGAWVGPECNLRCPTNNTLPCTGNGKCEASNATCSCSEGYVGDDCSIGCPHTTKGTCSLRGVCTDVGECVCDEPAKWGGISCNKYCGCELGRGYCALNGTCVCQDQFKGVTCGECADGLHGPDCSTICQHGTAVAQQCRCDEKWSGVDCDKPCPVDAGGRECNGHGACLWGSDRTDSACICQTEWFGETCSNQCNQDICAAAFPFGSAVCNQTTGTCECDSNHEGVQCSQCSDQAWGSSCQKKCPCSGRGSCDRVTGTCQCYYDPNKGHFSGDLCALCAPGWTGLPSCTQVNTPFPHLNTITSLMSQPTGAGTRQLLLIDRDIAWAGGDPAVFLDLSRQQSGGSAILDACPLVKGWVKGSQVFLLADVCGLHASPRLHRVPNPPVSADSDWEGRSGLPMCSSQSTRVCLSSELTDRTGVVDSVWPANGPLLVLLNTKVVALWVDEWGVTDGVAEIQLGLDTPRAVAAVGEGALYYACGLMDTAPGWACEGITAHKPNSTSAYYTLQSEGMLVWREQGASAPNCVELADAVGVASTTDLVMYVTLSPPGGVAVAVITHNATAGVPVVEAAELVYLSVTGSPSFVVLDPYSQGLYSSTCGAGSCSMYRLDHVPGKKARVVGEISLTSSFGLVDEPIDSIAAVAVDAKRRLLYVAPRYQKDAIRQQAPMDVLVMAAFGFTSVLPTVVLDEGGNDLSITGYGLLTPSNELLPPPETETKAKCIFSIMHEGQHFEIASSNASVVSEKEMSCTLPPREEWTNSPNASGVSGAHQGDIPVCAKLLVGAYLFDPLPASTAPYSALFSEAYVKPTPLPSLSSLAPAFIPYRPADHGTIEHVLVLGRGFAPTEALRCAFYIPNTPDGAKKDVEATGDWRALYTPQFSRGEYHTATSVGCPVPGGLAPLRTGFVTVSLDSQYDSKPLKFSVLGPPTGLVVSLQEGEQGSVSSTLPRTDVPKLVVGLVDSVGNPIDSASKMSASLHSATGGVHSNDTTPVNVTFFVSAGVSLYAVNEEDDARMQQSNTSVKASYAAFGGLREQAISGEAATTQLLYDDLHLEDARAGLATLRFDIVSVVPPLPLSIPSASLTLSVTAGVPHKLFFSTQPFQYLDRFDYYLVPTQGAMFAPLVETTARSSAPVIALEDALGSRLDTLSHLGGSKSIDVAVSVVRVGEDATSPLQEVHPGDGSSTPLWHFSVASAELRINPTSYSSAILGLPVVNGTYQPVSPDTAFQLYNVERYAFHVASPSHPDLGDSISATFVLENCPVGSFQDGAHGCELCPPEGTCDGSPMVATRAGFWRPRGNPPAAVQYYKCASKTVCPNVDGVWCQEGAVGPVCASCDADYVRSMDQCTACFPVAVSVLSFLLMVAIMIAIYAGWVAILASLLDAPHNTAEFEHASTLHALLFSSVLYLQCDGITAQIPGHPRWLRTLVLWEYRVSTGDIASFPISQCLIDAMIPGGAKGNFAVASAFVWLPLLSVVAALGAWRWRKRQQRTYKTAFLDSDSQTPSVDTDEDDKKADTGVSFGVLLRVAWWCVWYTQLHPLVTSCLDLLSCQEFIVEYTPEPLTRVRLRADTMIECDGSHRSLAIVSLVLFLALGVLYTTHQSLLAERERYALLRNERNHTNTDDEDESDAKPGDRRKCLIFLEGSFKDSLCRRWWLVLGARRLFIVFIIKYGVSEEGRLVAIASATACLLFATRIVKPYISTEANRFEAVLLMCTLAYTQVTVQQHSTPHPVLTVVAAMLKICSFLFILWMLWVAAKRWNGAASGLPRLGGEEKHKKTGMQGALSKLKKRTRTASLAYHRKSFSAAAERMGDDPDDSEMAVLEPLASSHRGQTVL